MLDTPHLPSITHLDRLAAALRAIRAVESAITAAQIAVLLEVARKPGLGVSEYARRLGESQPATSRNLQNLGLRYRDGKPGLGLVQCERHATDFRRVEYRLTEKGESLVWQIARRLSGIVA